MAANKNLIKIGETDRCELNKLAHTLLPSIFQMKIQCDLQLCDVRVADTGGE